MTYRYCKCCFRDTIQTSAMYTKACITHRPFATSDNSLIGDARSQNEIRSKHQYKIKNFISLSQHHGTEVLIILFHHQEYPMSQ